MKKLKNAKDEKMFTIDGAKEDIKDSALPVTLKYNKL